MKPILSFLFVLATALCGMAQSFSGKIVDDGGSPVGYATIMLSTAGEDAKPLAAVISNEDGSFSVKAPDNGEYGVCVSCFGYENYKTISAPRDMGVIQLKPHAVNLGEVVVKGHVSSYKRVPGGIGASVVGTSLSKAGSANNVLEHLPGMRKKQDGKVEVIGKGQPVIYINKRKIHDLSELERLRSDEIQRVELITTPGPEYDASVGAVIRISTIHKHQNGLGLELISSANYSHKVGTAQQQSLNYVHDRLECFGSFRYSLMQQHQTALNESNVFISEPLKQTASSVDEGNMQTLSGQLGFNYNLSDHHSFGTMYELMAMPRFKMFNHNITEVTVDDVTFDILDTYDSAFDRVYPTSHVNAFYMGQFGNFGIDFNADMLLGDKKSEEDIYESSESFDDYDLETSSKSNNKLYAGKLTLNYGFGSGSFFVGSEYTSTERKARSAGYNDVIEETDDRITDRNFAIYAGYNGAIRHFDTHLGLRYEHVTYDFYDHGMFQSDKSKKYDNVFPSLSIGTMSGNTKLELNYHIRTIRPAYDMLESNTHYGNRYTYLSGTPDLQPTYVSSCEFAAQWKDLRISSGFNHYKDDIFFATEQYADNPQISIIKFRNIKSRDEMFLQATYSPTFGLWKPEWNFLSTTQWMSVPYVRERRDMDGTIFHLNWSNAFSLPYGILFRVDGYWDSQGNRQNKRMRSTGYVNISLNKEFNDSRWNILLEGNDIFHTMREAAWQYDALNLQYRSSKSNTRMIRLTIGYKFNVTKTSYKGTGAGNDEMHRL